MFKLDTRRQQKNGNLNKQHTHTQTHKKRHLFYYYRFAEHFSLRFE